MTIEYFDDPFEALFDDPAEARRRTLVTSGKEPCKSFEEWLQLGDEECKRLATDEEYRKSRAKFLS